MTKYISLTNKYVEEVRSFFEAPTADIDIHLVETRKEFDEIEGSKTPDWVVGLTKNNVIYIFNPDKFEKYSTHSKDEFGSILKHEIAHLYFGKLKPSGHPNWLDEGVACYLDGKKKNPTPKKITVRTLMEYYDKTDRDIYDVGQYMVTKIIEKVGKKGLIDLIKVDSSDDLFHKLLTMFSWLK